MRNRKFHISLMAILTLCLSFFLPLYAGQDEDEGGNDCDLNLDGIYFVPVFFPTFDYYNGRSLVQLPGTASATLQTQKGAQLQTENDQLATGEIDDADREPPFPHVRKKPKVDKHHHRDIVALDHGSRENPFMVSDIGLYHIGVLLGASAVDPHSFIQFNLITKWQITKANSSHRWAEDYDTARKMKWGKTPKSAKEFDDWEIGDWMSKTGIVGIGGFAGVGWFTAEARAGGFFNGIWSRHIQKISENMIRIRFSREREGGPTARAQALPLQKAELKLAKAHDDTRTYVFDLTKEEDIEAVETLLNKRMLRAKGRAEELAEEGKGKLLSTKKVDRVRTTKTPFQLAIPLLFRYRIAHHVDRPIAEIVNHSKDTETEIRSRAYLKQHMYRHINLPKKEKGKKWKYFRYTQQHYNRSYAGSVVKVTNLADQTMAEPTKQHLHVQISFTHDNAKVKKFDKHFKEIAQQIGVNDFIVDTGYKDKARIGFVQVLYTLKVGDEALAQLIENNADQEKMFATNASTLIDNYFTTLNDPHDICKHSHQRLKNRCIRKVKEETEKSLGKIEKYLLRLYRDEVKASSKDSSRYLAKIARELSTNHFVLQSFVMSLPPKAEGYGHLEVFGERFLGKRFNVDPNAEKLRDDTIRPSDEEELLPIDWARIDAVQEDCDYY